jgi:hypothetical protein
MPELDARKIMEGVAATSDQLDDSVEAGCSARDFESCNEA